MKLITAIALSLVLGCAKQSPAPVTLPVDFQVTDPVVISVPLNKVPEGLTPNAPVPLPVAQEIVPLVAPPAPAKRVPGAFLKAVGRRAEVVKQVQAGAFTVEPTASPEAPTAVITVEPPVKPVPASPAANAGRAGAFLFILLGLCAGVYAVFLRRV